MIKNKEHTILIVEDDEVCFLYLSTLIGEHLVTGSTILYAKDGLEAVEICNRNDNVNLVFMDLKMPNMNGFEATKKIREFNPIVPIVAETGFSMNTDIEKALQAGCNEVITKPINKNTMFKVLSQYLSGQKDQEHLVKCEIR